MQVAVANEPWHWSVLEAEIPTRDSSATKRRGGGKEEGKEGKKGEGGSERDVLSMF